MWSLVKNRQAWNICSFLIFIVHVNILSVWTYNIFIICIIISISIASSETTGTFKKFNVFGLFIFVLVFLFDALPQLFFTRSTTPVVECLLEQKQQNKARLTNKMIN